MAVPAFSGNPPIRATPDKAGPRPKELPYEMHEMGRQARDWDPQEVLEMQELKYRTVGLSWQGCF
jgi:hypothetical protein